MTTPTAADFAHANIATRGTHDVARRVDPGSTLPWTYGDSEWEDDQGMADHGWIPVREHNPHAANALEEEIQDLRGRIRELNNTNDRLRDDLNASVEFVTTAPLNLDTLREAYEQAEVPTEDTPIRAGDVLVFRYGSGGMTFRTAGPGDGWPHSFPSRNVRVLSRAPRREPWRDLADVLRNYADHHFDGTEHTDAVAKHLHADGVRVVKGGDES